MRIFWSDKGNSCERRGLGAQETGTLLVKQDEFSASDSAGDAPFTPHRANTIVSGFHKLESGCLGNRSSHLFCPKTTFRQELLCRTWGNRPNDRLLAGE